MWKSARYHKSARQVFLEQLSLIYMMKAIDLRENVAESSSVESLDFDVMPRTGAMFDHVHVDSSHVQRHIWWQGALQALENVSHLHLNLFEAEGHHPELIAEMLHAARGLQSLSAEFYYNDGHGMPELLALDFKGPSLSSHSSLRELRLGSLGLLMKFCSDSSAQ